MAKRVPTMEDSRQYWLFKSEPNVFSIRDLAKAPRKTALWDGVRNYQARNFLRDTVKLGDRVLFYHSSIDPLEIAGTAEVVKAGYPDPTALDPQHRYHDPKSKPETPTWYGVDVKLVQIFPQSVTRQQLQESAGTASMKVLQRGMRLSIQPVTAGEWRAVHELAGVPDLP